MGCLRQGDASLGKLSLDATTNTTTRRQLERQTLAYARSLGRAKIVLVTVSVNNYLLRKYMEAALSGALLIGDVPCELAEAATAIQFASDRRSRGSHSVAVVRNSGNSWSR